MGNKELQRMNRRELLELLVIQSKENDRLKTRLEEVERMLADRQLLIDHAGSIANASIQINQVFEAAQDAADQYLQNIQLLRSRQEQICKRMEEESIKKSEAMLLKTKRQCQTLEAETADKCTTMIRDAEKEAERVMKVVYQKARQIVGNQAKSLKSSTSPEEGTDFL